MSGAGPQKGKMDESGKEQGETGACRKRQDVCVCVPARVLSLFRHVRLFATLWTVALQAPLSMGFSRQEHWDGLPCPPPGDLPDPGLEPASRDGTCGSSWQEYAKPPGSPDGMCTEKPKPASLPVPNFGDESDLQVAKKRKANKVTGIRHDSILLNSKKDKSNL